MPLKGDAAGAAVLSGPWDCHRARRFRDHFFPGPHRGSGWDTWPAPKGRKKSSWKRAKAGIRACGDRTSGQPPERQHSAAKGGTRDRLPPARHSKLLTPFRELFTHPETRDDTREVLVLQGFQHFRACDGLCPVVPPGPPLLYAQLSYTYITSCRENCRGGMPRGEPMISISFSGL